VKLEPRDVSEGSLLVEFPDSSESEANRLAVGLAERLTRVPRRGLLDAIPGARTLFVIFEPRLAARASLVALARRLVRDVATATGESRRFRIPVAYGGENGPDLADLARGRDMPPEELSRRHAAADYVVAFLGFSPGFPYLTGLPPELAAPRRDRPRPRVAAGSVAIGGPYTAVYPEETPGGWNLIGRSAVRLFDASASPPALLRAGDRVSFDAIGEDELRALRAEAAARAAARETPAVGEPLLEVAAPGLFTTIQGAARFGLGSSGVSAGGAMDPVALADGNAMVGNPPDAAALEMTLSGPEVLFRRDALVGVGGADLPVRWNGKAAPEGESFRVRSGDRLAFGYASRGARAYLCVAGGLRPGRPGEPSRRLAKGDVVFREPGGGGSAARVEPRAAQPGREVTVSVLPGPQQSDFPAEASAILFSASWKISAESDRRGIRLEGPALPLRQAPDIPPEGTALGAIQVPANGQPIVLGPDRPVTGGYAKIGTVVSRDWPLLAQAVPGSTVRFRAAAFSGPGRD
jgi:KipI family sensor histidine kinase inhibitor